AYHVEVVHHERVAYIKFEPGMSWKDIEMYVFKLNSMNWKGERYDANDEPLTPDWMRCAHGWTDDSFRDIKQFECSLARASAISPPASPSVSPSSTTSISISISIPPASPPAFSPPLVNNGATSNSTM
ncbi:hypothetical protein WDW89_18950, partial [Deltaproteobacteria bacterium TL4]